jgi:DNA-binding MarR family transcriptional regulator
LTKYILAAKIYFMNALSLDPLVFLLWQNSIEASLYIARKIQPLGLTIHDMRAITVLKQHGTMTAGELTSRLGITNGAVTGCVNRLIAAGVVKRETGGRDKRQRMISLQFSPLDAALDEIKNAAEALFSAYSAPEQALLLRHYQSIAEGLMKIRQKP